MRAFLFSLFLVTVATQQSKNFCRRHQHQTCMIDSKLYIDGGKIFYGGSVESGSIQEQNTEILWEDVHDTNNQPMFPVQHKNLTKDVNVPSTSGGVLWPDTTNKLFYLFGGEYDEVTDVQTFTNIWFFDVIYNTWNRSSALDGQADVAWPAFGAGTVSDAGIAYYYGGYLSNKTVYNWTGKPEMLNSLTSFDMNNQVWSNHKHDATPRAEGTLHYLPASSGGMLVYFGGVETNQSAGVSFANMSQIQLFDINDNKWFTQGATGDVPSPRRGSCAGLVWAADRSSYNLYVWGGIGESGQAFDEAYILTLPTFQWIRIHPRLPASVPNYGGKGWSSCNVILGSQMIIVGGLVTNKSMIECDVPHVGGQHGLLLGQENVEVGNWWHAVKNDTRTYRIPDQIVAVVGGDTDGHATQTTPVQGWATPSLSGYWEGTHWPRTPTATRFVPATSTPSRAITPSNPNKSNVGAIAGGTVGGVVAIASLCALIFLCLRRRRNRTRAQVEHENDARPDPHGPDMTQKHSLHPVTPLDNSILPYIAHSPAQSPQLSLTPGGYQKEQYHYHGSPQLQQQSGGWNQEPGYPTTQTYYPAPSDPSQSLQPQSPHQIRAELPDVRSPANAELSDNRSPVNGESHYIHHPMPVRGSR